MVDCHAGVLGSNSGGPKDFSLGITTIQPNSPIDVSKGVKKSNK